MSEGCVGVGSVVGFRVVGLSLLCTLVVLSGRVVGARVGGPAFKVFHAYKTPMWELLQRSGPMLRMTGPVLAAARQHPHYRTTA